MRADGGTWRYNVAFGLLMFVIAILPVRMVLLLRDYRGEALRQAERQQKRAVRVPARPGSLFARAGSSYVLLAGSRETASCFADPSLLTDTEFDLVVSDVGKALRLEKDEVREALVSKRDSQFAWLKRDISGEEAKAVQRLDSPAVGVTYEWRRYYPNETLASQTVGFRRPDGEPGSGLELSLQEFVSPKDGELVVLTDQRHRPIWTIPDESRMPAHGRDVYLSLDACIQGFLEKAVAAAVAKYGVEGRTWGAGVVVEPDTGRVLAMCSVPTFNPNQYATADVQTFLNRAVSIPYEPGSAAKPIFAASAVDAGVLTYDSHLFCENGAWRAPRGGTIRDHGERYGDLTVEDIVVHSSNIGMAKVGLLLGNGRLYAFAKRFGFGRKTGIETPGEDEGIVRDLHKWDTYSTPRVPFGQEVSVTAMQLAMAFCALTNGGELLRPRLVDYVCDARGRVVYRSQRQVVGRAISLATSDRTRKVLQQVVERGTGRACRLSKWSSFGKTGTAQVPGGPTGYIENAFTGTFVGGAPADKPRVLCLISVFWPDYSKGHFGATVAAPYVREVLENTMSYLNVPPETAFCAARGMLPVRQ